MAETFEPDWRLWSEAIVEDGRRVVRAYDAHGPKRPIPKCPAGGNIYKDVSPDRAWLTIYERNSDGPDEPLMVFVNVGERQTRARV